MKSVFTLLLAALFTCAAVAQDLSLSQESFTLAADGYIGLTDVILTNTGNDTVEVAVRLERVCLTSLDETLIQVCIGFLCYPVENATTTWGQENAPSLILNPGASEDQISFKPLPIGTHQSEWNLVFYDRNNPTNQAVINVVFEGTNLEACTPTSTTDFDYSIGKAFPNPALEIINISYEIDVNEANLNIYNATGKLVETVVVNPQLETVAVNVADYVKGVYFYNITDGKGQSKMMSFVK